MHEAHGWYVADAPAKVEGICGVLDAVGLRPATVLDVGCGAGAVLTGVCERYGAAGVGVDPDPAAIGLAQAAEGLRFVVGGLAEVEPAELVLCIDVFEHLEDDEGFLRALRGHGDWFAFRIPLDDSLWDRVRGRTARFREQYGHVHAYTWGSALRLLRRAGYDVRLVRPHRIDAGRLGDRVRWAAGAVAPRLATRVIGGWSLVVLARGPR